MKSLAIIGAGGHGKVVADCAEQLNIYDEIFFIDTIYPETKQVLHWQVKANDWQEYLDTSDFIVAIGNNHTRFRLTNELIQHGASVVNIIHPSAQVSKYSVIRSGTVIFANAIINCSASIGHATIINTGATIDHDCIIESAVHISPGANIAGAVNIGQCSWLGIGSSVIQCINIANNVIIGAGSCVTEHISEAGTYVGSPVRKIN